MKDEDWKMMTTGQKMVYFGLGLGFLIFRLVLWLAIFICIVWVAANILGVLP